MHLSGNFRDVYLSGAISGGKLLSKQPKVQKCFGVVIKLNQEEKIDLTGEEKEERSDSITSCHETWDCLASMGH